MVECMALQPGETVCDPACGTAGFLFAAHDHVVAHHKSLTREQLKHLKEQAFTGYELVQSTARLAAMNLLLHGIGSEKAVPVVMGDALAADPGQRFDVVLANPPFGKKSSTIIVGEDGRTSTEKDTIERDDFWATTSNKQLNFVQHIKTLLNTHGRAAVMLPDNVLFVEKRPASETPWTTQLWIYDLRTNKHFTLKTSPLTRTDLNEFVELYQAGNRHQCQATWSPEVDNAKGSGLDGRWRAYNCDDLVARDKTSLDIFWLKDDSLADSDNLSAPGVIALEIVEHLQAALEQFKLIAADMDAD